MKLQEKFAKTRSEITSALIERDEETDIVLTAMIAQENPLFVGPPGTAKSLLLDTVVGWMHGRKFSVLFNKFTTPEEVFGPLSVVGLKEDKYRRVTAGKLPDADAAFGDEIFKASSAILNTLLRILNERVYENGGPPAPVPLKLFVAASNEWPGADGEGGGKELAALFDRFLFRKKVKKIVSAEGRKRLLWERDHTPRLSTNITPAEIGEAHAAAKALPWSEEATAALETILRDLQKDGIIPGDRRQYKAVLAAQAFAYLSGGEEVTPEHLEILAHVLWDDPQEQPEKVASVVARIANPTGMMVNSHLMEVEQILASTDVRNLSQAATAAAKLQEIAKKLSAIKGGNGRVAKALAYTKDQIKRIKLASLESM